MQFSFSFFYKFGFFIIDNIIEIINNDFLLFGKTKG